VVATTTPKPVPKPAGKTVLRMDGALTRHNVGKADRPRGGTSGRGRGAGAATALAGAARAVAALGVLIITVQVMLAFAYRNLGKTTVTYGTATDVVTGLARVQRETLELAIELERLRLPDGLDKLAVRRGLLDQQIDVRLGSVPPGGVEREGLERARRQLKSFDAELARLRADRLLRNWPARGRPRRHVDAVQVTLKERYDVSEITFFGSIDDALRARTNLERVLIGTSGAILAVALILALSLRRRANRAFARAYRRPVQEVNEREAAEKAFGRASSASACWCMTRWARSR
jgi:hypothetical protein